MLPLTQFYVGQLLAQSIGD